MSNILTKNQTKGVIENWGQDIYSKILRNIETYSEKWKLSDLCFYEYYSINAIFFCKSELYGDCVLKIGGKYQDTEFNSEYHVLREYNGRRYVKVYEYDKKDKIMLIERVMPGERLSHEKSFEKRMDVFAELYNGLHIEPQNSEIYTSYLEWICEAVRNCEKSQKDLKGQLTHVYRAKEICLEVCETYNRQMLLHIDIYDGNIVSDTYGYRLIDPKGFIGDPVFETGQFIFAECCENGVEPEKIEIMLNRLEKSINIPQRILRQCFYIETVRFLCHEGASQDDIERIEFAEKVLNGIE